MCCTRACLACATATRQTRAAGDRLSANGTSGISAVLVTFELVDEVCCFIATGTSTTVTVTIVSESLFGQKMIVMNVRACGRKNGRHLVVF